MANDSRAAYFPLRSNAASMYPGAPGRQLVDRIKVAALLFDVVHIESGAVDLAMGTDVRIAMPSRRIEWLSVADRKRRGLQEMILTAVDDGAQLRLRTAEHFWSATFDPVVRELPEAFDWLVPVEVSYPDLDATSQEALLQAAWGPDGVGEPPFGESVLIRESVGDLVAADAMGAVLHVDTVHERLLSGLVESGSAMPVGGPRALSVACPEVGSLSWSEIDMQRRERGMGDLRKVLQEAEAVAVSGRRGTTDEAILRELLDRAVARSERAGLRAWLGVAGRSSISTILGLTPVGVPVEIARDAVATYKTTGTWLAALHQMRRRAGGKG
jgi:hypothetical protein